MLNLNKNTRLFFFQFIFQRNYSTDFELDEFIKQNIKKRPFNKKKLLSLIKTLSENKNTIPEKPTKTPTTFIKFIFIKTKDKIFIKFPNRMTSKKFGYYY